MTTSKMCKIWRRIQCSAQPVLAGLVLATAGPSCSAAQVAKDTGDGPVAAPHPVDLRPQFKQGRTTRYRVWTLRQVARSSNIRPSSTQKAEIEGELSWTVERVREDGSATCVLTLDWMSITATQRDGTLKRNDSRQASGDTGKTYALLRAMTGMPISFEVAADGKIKSVSGVNAIHAAVESKTHAPSDLDFIQSATDLTLLTAAPNKTRIDDQWQTQFIWDHDAGKMHHDASYKLESIERLADIPVAIVTGRSAMRLEVDGSYFQDDGPKPEIEMIDSDFKTQIMFDLTRHEAVGRNSIEQRTVQIKIPIGPRIVLTVIKEHIHSQALRIAEE